MSDHRNTLTTLGVSKRGLARSLGLDEGYFRQMLRNTRPIRPDLDAWLHALGLWLARHPPPRREAPPAPDE